MPLTAYVSRIEDHTMCPRVAVTSAHILQRRKDHQPNTITIPVMNSEDLVLGIAKRTSTSMHKEWVRKRRKNHELGQELEGPAGH